MKKPILALIMLALGLTLSACEEENQLEDAIEDAGDEIEEAADEVDG